MFELREAIPNELINFIMVHYGKFNWKTGTKTNCALLITFEHFFVRQITYGASAPRLVSCEIIPPFSIKRVSSPLVCRGRNWKLPRTKKTVTSNLDTRRNLCILIHAP